jgi:hypothetical protein
VIAREHRTVAERADRQRHAGRAGGIAALAGELAHDRVGITPRPRPRVVAAHLRRDRLVRLAQQRSPLAAPAASGPAASVSANSPATASVVPAMPAEPSTGSVGRACSLASRAISSPSSR